MVGLDRNHDLGGILTKIRPQGKFWVSNSLPHILMSYKGKIISALWKDLTLTVWPSCHQHWQDQCGSSLHESPEMSHWEEHGVISVVSLSRWPVVCQME